MLCQLWLRQHVIVNPDLQATAVRIEPLLELDPLRSGLEKAGTIRVLLQIAAVKVAEDIGRIADHRAHATGTDFQLRHSSATVKRTQRAAGRTFDVVDAESVHAPPHLFDEVAGRDCGQLKLRSFFRGDPAAQCDQPPQEQQQDDESHRCCHG